MQRQFADTPIDLSRQQWRQLIDRLHDHEGFGDGIYFVYGLDAAIGPPYYQADNNQNGGGYEAAFDPA